MYKRQISYSQTLNVTDSNESLNSDWEIIGPFCEDDVMPYNLTDQILGTTGGQFTGAGVLEIAPNVFAFTPFVAGSGIHAITYCVNAGAGCSSCTTYNIEVYETRSTEIQDIEICQSASGTVNLSAMMNGADMAEVGQ